LICDKFIIIYVMIYTELLSIATKKKSEKE